MWDWILLCWQRRQDLVQRPTSFGRQGDTNLEAQRQDEKVREEIGTSDGVEKLGPAATETLRIHHRRWRMSGKARRQRRGTGWIAWTGPKHIRTAGQGERKNQNRWRRDRGKQQKKQAWRRERGWNLAVRAGEGICYNIFGARQDGIAVWQTRAERIGKGRG